MLLILWGSGEEDGGEDGQNGAGHDRPCVLLRPLLNLLLVFQGIVGEAPLFLLLFLLTRLKVFRTFAKLELITATTTTGKDDTRICPF